MVHREDFAIYYKRLRKKLYFASLYLGLSVDVAQTAIIYLERCHLEDEFLLADPSRSEKSGPNIINIILSQADKTTSLESDDADAPAVLEEEDTEPTPIEEEEEILLTALIYLASKYKEEMKSLREIFYVCSLLRSLESRNVFLKQPTMTTQSQTQSQDESQSEISNVQADNPAPARLGLFMKPPAFSFRRLDRRYVRLKPSLVALEHVILRLLGFNLSTPNFSLLMLESARWAGLGRPESELSLSLLSDFILSFPSAFLRTSSSASLRDITLANLHAEAFSLSCLLVSIQLSSLCSAHSQSELQKQKLKQLLEVDTWRPLIGSNSVNLISDYCGILVALIQEQSLSHV